ncbi:MAG: MFS transporter [Alphaproteobacteria bacterium]
MSFFASRRFFPLFATQFLGAFNDNILKNALLVLITYKLAVHADDAARMVTLASGLFILPFFLFSATAGQLADKYDRAKLTRILKCTEFAIMLIAAAGFHFQHAPFLMFVLFAMGAQSAFFGPIKYSLLPQHLEDSELVAGNGYVEAGTFLAILLGTMLGGLLVMAPHGTVWVSGVLLSVALAGYAVSRAIPISPPPDPALRVSWNVVAVTWRMIGFSRENRTVFWCIIGISWFWMIGSMLLTQFPPFALSILHADETVVTLFYSAFSLGIAAGSLLCARLNKGRISTSIVPYAAVAMGLAIADCALAAGSWPQQTGALLDVWQFLEQGGQRVTLDLVVVAVSGGLFVVPLYAVMQHESDVRHMARIVAANNILNALFMTLSAVLVVLLLSAGGTILLMFEILAAGNLLLGLFLIIFHGNKR